MKEVMEGLVRIVTLAPDEHKAPPERIAHLTIGVRRRAQRHGRGNARGLPGHAETMESSNHRGEVVQIKR